MRGLALPKGATMDEADAAEDAGRARTATRGRAAADASFKSLTASVANALQRDLVAGVHMPGAKLPIVPLAKHYGVSPGAVREALSRLISEGLVEFNEQRGFRAAPVSQAALMDVTRTRILIDVHALREAIRVGDVEWEAEVLAVHHRLSNTKIRDDDNSPVRDEWQRLHRIFHRTLIAACGSEWLMRFHDLLFDQTIRYRSVAAAYETVRSDLRRDVHNEHAEIVRAAVSRDADAAAAALERHYMVTTNQLVEGQNRSESFAPERSG
jgi:DNA-binding GntR family transcriptional regulator